MLGADLLWDNYLVRLREELGRVDPAEVQALADALFAAWQKGRFVFVLGNGGSAASAMHLAADLGKNSVSQEDLVAIRGRRLKILSLTDNQGWITALGNDLAYDQIFVQQLANYASAGDLVIAISGSGNSPNVLAAVDWANAHDLVTFGVTGFDGGKLKTKQKAGLHVRLNDMAMVESVHSCVFHWIVDDLWARVNRQGRYMAEGHAACDGCGRCG